MNKLEVKEAILNAPQRSHRVHTRSDREEEYVVEIEGHLLEFGLIEEEGFSYDSQGKKHLWYSYFAILDDEPIEQNEMWIPEDGEEPFYQDEDCTEECIPPTSWEEFVEWLTEVFCTSVPEVME